MIEFSSDTTGDSNLSEADILALASSVWGTEGDDIINGSSMTDIIHGGGGNDTITDYGNTNTLYGEAGNDILAGKGELYGGAGNDTLTGTSNANNTLDGGDGDDVIGLTGDNYIRYRGYASSFQSNSFNGGTGNDTLSGLLGEDTYLYNLGDGQDILTDTGGADKIIFGSDITPDMVSFKHNLAGDLLITIIDSNNASNNGSIRLAGGYVNDANRIEVIEFSSDTTGDSNLSESEILEKAAPYIPPAENNLSLEVASLQLIQAHSVMGNDGDEGIAGDVSNNNLSVLPVLDS